MIDSNPTITFQTAFGDEGDVELAETSVETSLEDLGATVGRCCVDLYEPEIAVRVTRANPKLRENNVNLHGHTGRTVLSRIIYSVEGLVPFILLTVY